MAEEQINFDDYHDRGMKKWGGFFLSEHTAIMNQLKEQEANPNLAKPEMTLDEITMTIHEALVKSKQVNVQLLEKDLNGYYEDDIIGTVNGYDNVGLYIGSTPVMIDNIRNIQFEELIKWSQF